MRVALLLWLFCQPSTLVSQQGSRQQPPPVEQTKPKKQATQADKSGTQASPFVVKLDSIQANRQAAEADEERHQKATTDLIFIFFTGALVVIGTAQAILFFVQLRKIDRSLIDSKKSADAAYLAAQAAVHVERPQVMCTDVVLEAMPRGGTQDPETGAFNLNPEEVKRGDFYRVTFVFTNYGKTPAFVTEVGYGQTVAGSPPALPAYEAQGSMTDVIKPGKEFLFLVPDQLNISVEQQRAVTNGSAFPWFWGHICYRDFLDGSEDVGFIAYRHDTQHLPTNVQVPPSGVTFSRSLGYSFRHYSPGNGESSTAATQK